MGITSAQKAARSVFMRERVRESKMCAQCKNGLQLQQGNDPLDLRFLQPYTRDVDPLNVARRRGKWIASPFEPRITEKEVLACRMMFPLTTSAHFPTALSVLERRFSGLRNGHSQTSTRLPDGKFRYGEKKVKPLRVALFRESVGKLPLTETSPLASGHKNSEY